MRRTAGLRQLPGARGWHLVGKVNRSEAWCLPADGAPDDAGRRASGGLVQIRFPDLENQDRAFMTLVVHPAGGDLAGHSSHAQRRAAAQKGRTVIDASAFRVGGRRRPAAWRGPASWTRVASTCARRPRHSRRCEGDGVGTRRYSLTSWTGVTPDDKLDQVAQVQNAMNDAPREEAGSRDDVWDADPDTDARRHAGTARGAPGPPSRDGTTKPARWRP